MTFSEKEGKFVFGLSGNPVSSFVQFELIAKPMIYKLLGANYAPLRIKTRMKFTYQRKKANRLAIIPVVIDSDGGNFRDSFSWIGAYKCTGPLQMPCWKYHWEFQAFRLMN